MTKPMTPKLEKALEVWRDDARDHVDCGWPIGATSQKLLEAFREWRDSDPEQLKPIPTLPPDHIDRFWVVGAWIRHPSFPGESAEGWPSTCVVLDEESVVILHEDWMCTRTRSFDDVPKTGWSFHESSPIQTQREVEGE